MKRKEKTTVASLGMIMPELGIHEDHDGGGGSGGDGDATGIGESKDGGGAAGVGEPKDTGDQYRKRQASLPEQAIRTTREKLG